jgi:hypothetical protein
LLPPRTPRINRLCASFKSRRESGKPRFDASWPRAKQGRRGSLSPPRHRVGLRLFLGFESEKVDE